ncbi:MAG TPA: DUF3536 domain-containing protein, partial [Patescibacteria group bacterium]|nr:DUF3536 domain-containing protein [Patescibacteria group bacterium]
WFFDDISGIESIQVIEYAGRAIQLAEELFGNSFEHHFVELLDQAKSNIPNRGNGRSIYERFVKTAIASWEKLGAHYSISSLFEDYPPHNKIYCYSIDRQKYQHFESGKVKLAIGRVKMTSEITTESAQLIFGALYLGGHDIKGGVLRFQGEESYRAMVKELGDAFIKECFNDVLLLLDKHFEKSIYSLRSLFRDEQRKILNILLKSSLAESEAAFSQLYEQNAPIMRFVTSLGIPPSKAFYSIAELVLNSKLRNAFENEELDIEGIKALLEEAKLQGVSFDSETLEYSLRMNIERMAEQLLASPADIYLLQKLEEALDLTRSLPFMVNLWRPQNAYYKILKTVYPKILKRAEKEDESAKVWISHFTSLGENLSIRVR